MEKAFKKRLTDLFNGLSVPKIADQMQVNYHTLTNWVTGRTDFPPSELAKIARLTNGSLTWLLTGEGEKHIGSERRFTFDDLLETKIRQIVREELAKPAPPGDHVGELQPAEQIVVKSIGKVNNESEEITKKRKVS